MEKRFLGVLIFLFFTIGIFAQKNNKKSRPSSTAVSVSMRETTDIVPGDDRRRDKNKQFCAIVKVEVLDEIVDVEGPVMEIINKGVEKWIYMAQGSRNMKLQLKNNFPVTVNFSKYGIKSLKGNRVYIVRLDVPNKLDPNVEANIKRGTFQVRVTPPTAKLSIWGEGKGEETYPLQDDGSLKVEFPYGRYRYRVSAEGYRSVEDDIFVNDENKWNTIELEVIKGELTVNGITKNAELYIDNVLQKTDKKTTVWRGELPQGQHVVELRRKGYIGEPKIVNVIAGHTENVLLSLMTEREYKKTHSSTKVNFLSLVIGAKITLQLQDGSTVSGIWMGISNNMVKIRQDNPSGEYLLFQKDIIGVKHVN